MNGKDNRRASSGSEDLSGKSQSRKSTSITAVEKEKVKNIYNKKTVKKN